MKMIFAALPRLDGNLSLWTGSLLVGAMTLIGLIGPVLIGATPFTQDLHHTFAGMSWAHPFGTDAFGRDIAARVVYGARYSLVEAGVSLAISCSAGTVIGLVSGAAGKLADGAIMWVIDIVYAFPGVILALLIVSILGPGLVNMLLAISIFSIPVYARLARNLALELRRAPFVEAATTMGASFPAIVFRHILPNTVGPILVQSTVSAGSVILMAASLSFLGLGVQPPAPEWGAMMSDGRNYVGAFLLPSLFPGLAIMILILGFNLLGEGLRHVFSRQ